MSELAKLVDIPTHGKPSNNKNDFYLSSLIDDDPWKALPKHEKQLLQIDFDRPETIRMVTAGSKFSARKPSPPPSIWAEYSKWKDNSTKITKWWREYNIEKCNGAIEEYISMGHRQRNEYRQNIRIMISDQQRLFCRLKGTPQTELDDEDADMEDSDSTDSTDSPRSPRRVSLGSELDDCDISNEGEDLLDRFHYETSEMVRERTAAVQAAEIALEDETILDTTGHQPGVFTNHNSNDGTYQFFHFSSTTNLLIFVIRLSTATG